MIKKSLNTYQTLTVTYTYFCERRVKDMKKEYETPTAEKMVFDYTDSIVTSYTAITNKNPNQGCTQNSSGQSMQNPNKCGGGAGTKNKKC